ncbi:MAG: prephenate dehydrogenase/arogenate dehydrogenase family protein [Candidatus Margulisbacteria bacterium]|nr:prephenate dehydrogenase/arogenate dehydrogenase family protein [Candidatus Margulisiibacteriota bacterium]
MRIAIIGLGLIGGSIGLGLKRSGIPDLKIIGIPRREETLRQAIELGAIDEGTTDHVKGVVDADLVFVCTPINLILPVISEISKGLKKGAIVTDVGSSKYEIVSAAEKAMPKGSYFVGGHPMAGKETTKLDAAEADLFKNKTWILTKTSKTSQKAFDKVAQVVGWLGGSVVDMDPKTHDLVVAGISHLPLAVAAALVNSIAVEAEKDLMAKAAASGFRDTTRVASGDPILGVDMFTTNRKAVLKMIGSFKKALANLEKLVKEGNGEKIREELKKAKQFRDQIFG